MCYNDSCITVPAVWSLDPDIDIKKAPFGDLEHQSQLRTSGDFVEKAFLCMGVNL